MGKGIEYLIAYETARQELRNWIVHRSDCERRIIALRQSLQSLAVLCKETGHKVDPSPDLISLLTSMSLTDEVRAILQSSDAAYMQPRDVKDELIRLGRDLTRYQNPQSVVQVVLKRLVERGEAKELEIPPSGKKGYCYLNKGVGKIAAFSLGDSKQNKDERSTKEKQITRR